MLYKKKHNVQSYRKLYCLYCWSTVCLDTLGFAFEYIYLKKVWWPSLILSSVHLFLWLMKMLSKPAKKKEDQHCFSLSQSVPIHDTVVEVTLWDIECLLSITYKDHDITVECHLHHADITETLSKVVRGCNSCMFSCSLCVCERESPLQMFGISDCV